MTFASPLRWMRPAPDSLVAQDLRLGRSPWTHHIHLVWSIWVFLTPAFSGGAFGVGLGASKQKLAFLPEMHTDFIVSIMGEELGFVGMSVLFILMGMLVWRGLLIAYRQEDLRDRLLAFGLVLIIALGAMLNLAVIMGVVPTKGVAMPFLSYGGSSMVCTLAAMGFLLNFSRTAVKRRP